MPTYSLHSQILLMRGKHKVQFLHSATKAPSLAMSYANDLKASEFAMEEAEGKVEPFMTIRPHLCQPQPISDESTSATSRLQIQTVQECLPLLNAVTDSSSNPLDFNKFGLPSLHRGLHLDFIHNGLQPLPASFVTMDASRPWLMYWSFLSLNLLGEDVKVLRHRQVSSMWQPSNVLTKALTSQAYRYLSAFTKRVWWFRRRPGSSFSSCVYLRSDSCHCHSRWTRNVQDHRSQGSVALAWAAQTAKWRLHCL